MNIFTMSSGDPVKSNSPEMSGSDKQSCINWKYFPIKAHYFFFFGSMGGTVPYIQVLGKDLGISATLVGLVYTLIPFCVFLSKPFFGYLTDKFQNIRLIVVSLVIVTAAAFLAILFVPPVNDSYRHSLEVKGFCSAESSDILILPDVNNLECSTGTIKTMFSAIACSKKGTLGNPSISLPDVKRNDSFFEYLSQNISENICECIRKKEAYSYVAFYSDEVKCLQNESQHSGHIYRSSSFWLYGTLSLIGGVGAATLFCLSDAVCYEILTDENSNLYGRQRLWGTISWGIVTLLTGVLNDVASSMSNRSDYSPGFYIMCALVLIDLIVLSRIELVKSKTSKNICKDIAEIFSSRLSVLFAVGVFISGTITGLLWNYQFWFLTDLGAHQTLLGLVIAVQCLITEVPFFFFSEWFIVKFGHFYCLVGALAAFALRTGLYSVLVNPWLVLPIDLLHGVTFGIFYSAMVLYAANNAPPGAETTMLGVLGGLYEGLGVAVGSLLGGLGFDKLGGRRTFLCASIISLLTALLILIFYNIMKKSSTKG